MASKGEKRGVLLATHIEPVIHGQAMMASHLAQSAQGWEDVPFYTLNTVYAEERGGLGGFSLSKISKLCGYMMTARRLIREHRISHVILCVAFFKGPFLKDAMMIQFLKKCCGVEVVSWVHMDPNRMNAVAESGWMRRVVERTLGEVSHWVACAPALLQRWPAWLQRQPKLHAICNGIEDTGVQVSEVSEQGICRVTYLSAMDDEKGWRELYQAAELILAGEHGASYEFHFYGGAGKQDSEEELRAHFGEAPKGIYWHGAAYGDAKAAALREASLFVLPSHTEQFPLALLDAMSYGLPVVATDVGAITDAIASKHLAAAPMDPQWLAEKILAFGQNPECLRAEGEKNLKKFREEFTLEQFSKQWHELLATMLNGQQTSI